MPKRNASPEESPDDTKRQKQSPPTEWPPLFTLLENVHRDINSLFTFSQGLRRDVTTTLEMARKNARASIRHAMTVEHLAMVASLLPGGSLVLEYKDERLLQAREADPFDTSFTHARNTWIRADATDKDWRDRPSASYETPIYTLCYEFTAGDRKRKMDSPLQRGKHKAPPARREMSHAQIMKLVVQRNQAFHDAVGVFLADCAARGTDPVADLQTHSHGFLPSVPRPPTSSVLAEHGEVPPEIPTERASARQIIQKIYASPWYIDQVSPEGRFTQDPRPASYDGLEFLLSQRLVDAVFNARGVTQFYTHQADALNALHRGENIMVATSTGSGKSLIFQLPVLYALEQNPNVRAFYIFPTKALAQDQKHGLCNTLAYMRGMEDVLVDTFDGDTPVAQRDLVRESARIIFTNPDMLHLTILPQHNSWGHVLANLRYVVVDELHCYDDRFGAHMAYVMRRLRRLCAIHGNTGVQFIACSGTISNPAQHFQRIFGVSNVTLISRDGSPSVQREHVIWNTSSPNLISAAVSSPDHAADQVTRLFCGLLLHGLRILLFCETTAQVELILARIHAYLLALDRPECVALVNGYRGGYTAPDRRRIETALFSGTLRGVVATSALEVGVDVGALDCVITWGFPRSVASLRQQWGRAGRSSSGDALLVFVAGRSAADQYVVSHVDELRTVQTADIWSDLSNAQVRGGQLNCAAAEAPIDLAIDSRYFGVDLGSFLRPTEGAPPLVEDMETPGLFYPRAVFRGAPAKSVAIRDIDADVVTVVDLTGGRYAVLEEMTYAKAQKTMYKNGEYLHQGEGFVVREFNARERIAKVEKR
ncbi:hypothetical protein TD95_002378 [Thielaviopsis punctulata]|uniref:P-loop containing nucleoside triphosphate hydrolase protein n=1 Tax=Thielaviopsis punctulata TaxID=72032 RepID=A0A0F4ZFL2_9PEZI|nr:hypothetical protein TD95_002378 [Thielaviopsis punctulata]